MESFRIQIQGSVSLMIPGQDTHLSSKGRGNVLCSVGGIKEAFTIISASRVRLPTFTIIRASRVRLPTARVAHPVLTGETWEQRTSSSPGRTWLPGGVVIWYRCDQV